MENLNLILSIIANILSILAFFGIKTIFDVKMPKPSKLTIWAIISSIGIGIPFGGFGYSIATNMTANGSQNLESAQKLGSWGASVYWAAGGGHSGVLAFGLFAGLVGASIAWLFFAGILFSQLMDKVFS